ncbi:protein translocase subunit SecF [Candidatus Falkowbacteria bacterium CG10_big_fil_rev_8_21_14_0_10_43_10]|uniref:Protein-export membrane protein SecF n=1 Tax=Candidatus Falkowbacteria bacterium CG10_big_fil_rev_8_21_14_0_10_43_10 TaxID=1974567 RepID=A0A2H0V2Z1_9BACT|nr:MAG: protein translocase subunit SecF [Candidatus Falkowbacteria bacterium CG10_big_fil_rev_8_21_14_0_10_43_10]
MRLMYRAKLWLSIAGLVTLAGIVCFAVFGLKPGIDFTGGSLLEIKYNEAGRPAAAEIRQLAESTGIGSVSVQLVDEAGAQLRFKEASEEQHQALLQALNSSAAGEGGSNSNASGVKVETEGGGDIGLVEVGTAADENIEELRFETIGPSIGQELKTKAVYAIIVCLIVIIAYITWSFRHVSKPVASWKYGVASIIALFHDIMVVVGVFAILGHYWGIEIDSSFIAALLTVLGYSINDTIVVLDRVRENLPRSNEDFEGTVNTSINQTLARSVNTTLTTVLALIALLLFGGDTVRYFMLALTIGIASGAYSSIFIAAPILVIWEKWQRRN